MGTTGFVLTPHKLSMCILLQAYALPSSTSPPLPQLPLPTRHKFSLFVLQMIKAHDDFLEPSFEELARELKGALQDGGGLLISHVASRLVNFLSPEDLCTFALGLRELLATAPEVASGEDEPLMIDSNSLLGHFLRRCILAFNLLSFEGMCKLLTDLDLYRQPILMISGGQHSMQNSVSKNMDMGMHDEDQPDDDDYYFEDDSSSMERSLSNIQNQSKRESGEKTVAESFGGEGFVYGESNVDGELNDEGFTFEFGYLRNKIQSANEGCFLCTNDQLESYLRGLADIIEREMGLFTPDEIEVKLNQLEKLAPDFLKVHYSRYLNCLSNADYPAAMDSLHRYFDYSAGKGALNGGGSGGASTGRFQAGLLALGSMHARFGHITQALHSLNEAVGIAQQNNDDACLAHALAALCHLISEVGALTDSSISDADGSKLDARNGPSMSIEEQLLLLLNCCLRRAVELKLPHLVAFSRLVLAKFNLKFVRRSLHASGPRSSEQLVTSPLDVYKTLRLSPFLLSSITGSSSSVACALSTDLAFAGSGKGLATASGLVSSQDSGMVGKASVGVKGYFTSARADPIVISLLQLGGTAHLLREASWELFGSAPMARVSALIHATCYRDVASADDLSLAYVKLANYLARHRSYNEACTALDIAARKFPSVGKSRVRAARLQIVHERALHQGDIKTAHAACDMLSGLFSTVEGVDIESKFDLGHRRARTLVRAGQFAEAASMAHSLFNMCCKYKMQLENIKSLLLLAEIHKKARSFVSGLPYALAALTLSKSLNMDLVHAAAMVTLAELWLGLGPSHAEQALGILQQCMPLVLGHGERELRARIYIAVAQCHLSNPSYSVNANPQAVCEPLQEAAEEFESLEDNEQLCEVFHLQALVFNALGATEERDHAATLFQKFTLLLKNFQTGKP